MTLIKMTDHNTKPNNFFHCFFYARIDIVYQIADTLLVEEKKN